MEARVASLLDVDYAESGMTILGAAITDKAVYLSADSLEFDEDGFYETGIEKIVPLSEKVPTVGVAWFGASRPGKRLLDALELVGADTWPSFIKHVTRFSKQINRHFLDRGQPGAGLLIAGYIGEEPRILVWDDAGTLRRSAASVQFAGMYSSNARDVWRACGGGTRSPDRGIRWTLEQIVDQPRYGIAKPILLWRVPTEGNLELVPSC